MQIAILQKGTAWQDSILLPSGRLQQLFASLNIQRIDRITDSAPEYSKISPPEYSKTEWQTASWIFNEYEAKQTTSILKDYLHRLI